MSSITTAFRRDTWFKFDDSSEAGHKPHKEKQTEYDLIAFLALLQTMKVAILPITWHSASKEIGKGLSGLIMESPMNSQTSLVFKRVKQKLKYTLHEQEKMLRADIFRTLINEVTVLSHPRFRKHKNIIELQGVCWDFEDNNVWPVLIFEKAQHGDLEKFLKSPEAKHLSLTERLSLCIEVGLALIDMHSQGFIHGDVKPENVLIFKEHLDTAESIKFTAKLIDFGYSTRYEDDDDYVLMPRSWPWDAPEHCFKCKAVEAQKMELYSFGMLCIWTMFEHYLSNPSRLPQKIPKSILDGLLEPRRKSVKDPRKEFLAQPGVFEKLRTLSRHIILKEQKLGGDQEQPLVYFFSETMTRVDRRASSVEQAFRGFLSRQRLSDTSKAGEVIGHHVLGSHFKISRSIQSFYESDFRLRSQIRYCLEQKVLPVLTIPTSIDPDLTFQLAICYSIGFGGAGSDPETKDKLLLKSAKSQEELQEAIELAHKWEVNDTEQEERKSTIYESLLQQGYIHRVDLINEYRKSEKLDEAECNIRQELLHAGWETKKESRIIIMLSHSLSSLLSSSGRWKEAQELEAQLVEGHRGELGTESRVTLISMKNLALLCRYQGKWESATSLGVEMMETCKRTCGPEHRDTLTIMEDLALIYRKQCLWEQAESLGSQVAGARYKALGPQHPSTLDSMANLALTYMEQRKWNAAEELQLRVVENYKQVFGPQHPFTMTRVKDLESIYKMQERLDKLYEFRVSEKKDHLKSLDPWDPKLFACMKSLAQIYRKLGCEGKASGLETQVTAAKVPLPLSSDSDSERKFSGFGGFNLRASK